MIIKDIDKKLTTDELIHQLTECIYEGISQRVARKKKQLNKLRSDIVDTKRETLLSHVCNNKRYPKKNDYLLTPSIIEEIVENLEFENDLNLVWGADEERIMFLEGLFYCGLAILESGRNKVLIKNLFMNYLPFARSCAFIDEKNEHGDIEGLIDRGHEHLDYNIKKENERIAKQRLFRHCREELIKQHEEFFRDKGTSKIDKEIKKFFETVLLDMLREIGEKEERGKNVYDLIRSIVYDSCTSWLIYMNYIEDESRNSEVHQRIGESFSKGMDYVDSIILVQKLLENQYA